jgi:hypothetical protein
VNGAADKAKGIIKDVIGKAIGDKKTAGGRKLTKQTVPHPKLRATLRMPFEKRQRQQTKTEQTMLVDLQTLPPL